MPPNQWPGLLASHGPERTRWASRPTAGQARGSSCRPWSQKTAVVRWRGQGSRGRWGEREEGPAARPRDWVPEPCFPVSSGTSFPVGSLIAASTGNREQGEARGPPMSGLEAGAQAGCAVGSRLQAERLRDRPPGQVSALCLLASGVGFFIHSARGTVMPAVCQPRASWPL